MASQLVPILTNEATAARRQVYFHLVDATDGITAETGEAAGQPQISTNGGAWTNTGIGTLSAIGNGEYFAEVTQSATNITAGGRIKTRYKSAATAEARGDTLMIMGADPFVALASANVTQWLGSAPNALVSGRVDSSVGAMAANVLTATAINADAITAAKVAADVQTEIRSIVIGTSDSGTTTTMVDSARTEADTDYWKGAWILFTSGTISGQTRLITAFTPGTDTITFTPATTQAVSTQTYEILPSATAEFTGVVGDVQNALDNQGYTVGRANQLDNLDATVSSRASAIALAVVNFQLDDVQTRLPAPLTIGTSDSGSTTTMVDAARTEADTDYWKGAWIRFTSGNITKQTRLITGFNAGTDTITFTPATTQAVTTQTYEILPAGAVDVRLWNGTAPNVLVSGRVDASVGATAAGSIVAATFGAGAIDAAAVATDAIGALEVSTAAAAEIAGAVWDQSRGSHVVAGSFGEGVASVQGNVTGSVASVTGNVGGNVVGSVGSIAAGGLTAASTDATYVTEVQGAADAALVGRRLDELIDQVASPITPTIDSFWDLVTSKDGSQAYDRATDSLEAVKDAIGGGGLTQQQVRDAMKLAPTAGAPAAGSVDLHLDEIEADTAAMQPLVDVAISTRAAPGDAMDLITDAIDSNSVAATGVTEIQAGLATAANLALVQADTTAILADTNTIEPIVSANLDVAVSTRAAPGDAMDLVTDAVDSNSVAATGSNEIALQVDVVLSGTHGAGAWGGGGGLSAQNVRDAMKLAPTAGAPAAGSVDEHLDDILADTSVIEPLVSTNLNATVSSRAIPGDAMDLITDAVDSNSVGATGVAEIQSGLATSASLALVQADTTAILADTNVIEPLVSSNLDATVSSRSVPGDAMDLVTDAVDSNSVAATGANEIALEVDVVLSGTHGGGAWGGGGGLSAQNVRDAMKLAPTAGAPAAGSVDEHLDDILADTAAIQPLVTANLDATVSSRAIPGDAMDLVANAVDAAALDPSAGTEIGTAVDTTLTASHGAGAWGGAGAPTVPQIVAGVWDEALAGHLTAGSTGAALDAAASGGAGLTQQQVADALKLAPAAGAPDPGSAYDRLIDIETCACAGGAGGDVEVVGI